MSAKDDAARLRERFPGLDRYLLSKALQPEKYGVTLTKEAQELLKGKALKKPQNSRSGRSKERANRLVVRVSDEALRRLQLAKIAFKRETTQDVLSLAVEVITQGLDRLNLPKETNGEKDHSGGHAGA